MKTITSRAAIMAVDLPHDAILGCLQYLEQCLADRSGVALVIGGDKNNRRSVLDRFAKFRSSDEMTAFGPAPTDDVETFLAGLLQGFGFEPFESAIGDLRNLLKVFFTFQRGQERQPVVIIPEAHRFGPRVLSELNALIARRRSRSACLWILAGDESLTRIVQAPAMKETGRLTKGHYHLDRGPSEAQGRVSSPGARSADSGADVDSIPSVVLQVGGCEARRISLISRRTLIGRESECDISIDSPYISRQHAMLVTTPAGTYVVDLKSANGTRVNGEPVDCQPLCDGDLLRVGNSALTFHDPRQPERDWADQFAFEVDDTCTLSPIATVRTQATAEDNDYSELSESGLIDRPAPGD